MPAGGRLAGKVAIVTGAGSRTSGMIGTGRAMAVLFAREGARVCVLDLELERAEETASLIEAEGGESMVVAGDVSLAADCERVVTETVTRYGGLDVLVNNAALSASDSGTRGRVHELDQSGWERIFAVNLEGAMLMSKHALPRMIETGGGSIVSIASVAALMSDGLVPAYAAAKAGLVRLTADIAVSYGRDGIRANTIVPGMLFTGRQGELSPERAEQRRRAAPLGIEGDAWDVAWAAVYLASDEARFVTGVCLPVDGGLLQTQPLTALRLLDN
ncbi:MAG TPA: SDR family oxidoreductase [Gaiellaceae bacterium]|nr:SDR family oxidoreductase [Gaiellaceae bacterium]